MADTAAGILVDIMREWGVDTIFGFPGDGVNGFFEALRRRQDRVRFIQVRHEEAAGIMACGYAHATGRIGACVATSGPGGIHLLSGLYEAKLQGLPVVAVTGHHYHDLIGTHAQQDVDLGKVFADVSVYSERVMGPAHAENVAHEACRIALGERGVAHINIPTDIQGWKHERVSPENVAHHQGAVPPSRAGVPSRTDLQDVAAVLNAGERVVLLAGARAQGAGRIIDQIADKLGAPVITERPGHGLVLLDSAHFAGNLGPLASAPALQAVRGCDTLFLIGAALPYDESALVPPEARVAQLEPEAGHLGLHYAVDAGLVGDPALTLEALLPLVQGRGNRDFLGQAQQGMRDWQQAAQARDGQGIPLAALSLGLGRRLPPQRIAPSLPWANAVQVARPDRPCAAVVSEDGFAMLMAEFVTAVKYGLPVRALVLKDPGLPLDLVAFAEACGGTGHSVRSAGECEALLDKLLDGGGKGPVLIEAVVRA